MAGMLPLKLFPCRFLKHLIATKSISAWRKHEVTPRIFFHPTHMHEIKVLVILYSPRVESCWFYVDPNVYSFLFPSRFPRVLSKFSQVPEFWNVFPTFIYNFIDRLLQLPKCGWEILYLQRSINKFVTYPYTMGMPKTINIQTTDLEYTCLNSHICVWVWCPQALSKSRINFV